MEGWFRLGAEGSIGFIPSSCAVGPLGVSSGMISGSSEGSDLVLSSRSHKVTKMFSSQLSSSPEQTEIQFQGHDDEFLFFILLFFFLTKRAAPGFRALKGGSIYQQF